MTTKKKKAQEAALAAKVAELQQFTIGDLIGTPEGLALLNSDDTPARAIRIALGKPTCEWLKDYVVDSDIENRFHLSSLFGRASREIPHFSLFGEDEKWPADEVEFFAARNENSVRLGERFVIFDTKNGWAYPGTVSAIIGDLGRLKAFRDYRVGKVDNISITVVLDDWSTEAFNLCDKLLIPVREIEEIEKSPAILHTHYGIESNVTEEAAKLLAENFLPKKSS